MPRRFVIGQISHETNVFSPIRTEIRHFTERGYSAGDKMFEMEGTRTGIGGFIQFAKETGCVLVPTVSASAVPSGTVARDAYETLLSQVLDGIKNAGKIDGVLLALHGAMVVTGVPDAEGDILSRVREVVGPDTPVAATLDLHANMTDLMVEKADGLFGYNTYPHVDGYERAIEAGYFVLSMLEGKVKPVSVLVRPEVAPAAPPARSGSGPLKKMFDKAYEYEKLPGVVNVSVFGGFVHSDIKEAGLAVLATTNDDYALAENIAVDLGRMGWDIRREFLINTKTPDEAVKYAIAAARGPIVLADVADNTGGGASGDGTEILRALLENDAQSAVVISIPDPEAVEIAFRAGVGGRFEGFVGGKIDDKHGAPVKVVGYVRLLSDGVFVHKGPMSTGVTGHMGRTAVIVSGGVEIIVNEKRFQPLDSEVPRSVGINPADRKIVVLKSEVHYRACYEPIAAEILEVDGPGLCSPNLSRFAWKNIRRPVYPIDLI